MVVEPSLAARRSMFQLEIFGGDQVQHILINDLNFGADYPSKVGTHLEKLDRGRHAKKFREIECALTEITKRLLTVQIIITFR